MRYRGWLANPIYRNPDVCGGGEPNKRCVLWRYHSGMFQTKGLARVKLEKMASP